MKDLNQFLRAIEEFNDKNLLENCEHFYMCSFDVVSMFPSIDQEQGLKACEQHLDCRSEPLFSTECIIEALKISLDYNLTSFNGTVYSQTKGTAMGPSNACDYADVAMSDFDRIVHSEEIKTKHNLELASMLERFRDDIFVIWLHELQKLRDFFTFINTINPNMKYTMTEPSISSQEFLQVLVYRQDGKLHTRTYSKPCDNHQYLSPLSCHPTHTLQNIPYSIAFSVFKICSNKKDYLEAKIEYSKYLEDRGYSKECVGTAFAKVEKLNRSDLIKQKVEEEDQCESCKNGYCFPLTMDFNPNLPPVGKFIYKHKHLLELDPVLCKTIPPSKVFASYRGNKTLKKILAPSKLFPLKTSDDNDLKLGCFKCNKNCKMCKLFLNETNEITSFHTEQKFKIRHHLDCNSPYCIYLIDDMLCYRSYTGSTINPAKDRWSKHKSHIKHNLSTCELARHFTHDGKHNFDRSGTINEIDVTLKEHLRITIIDIEESHDLSKLKEREAYWQHQLRTFTHFGGLNKRDSREETSITGRSYLSPN